MFDILKKLFIDNLNIIYLIVPAILYMLNLFVENINIINYSAYYLIPKKYFKINIKYMGFNALLKILLVVILLGSCYSTLNDKSLDNARIVLFLQLFSYSFFSYLFFCGIDFITDFLRKINFLIFIVFILVISIVSALFMQYFLEKNISLGFYIGLFIFIILLLLNLYSVLFSFYKDPKYEKEFEILEYKHVKYVVVGQYDGKYVCMNFYEEKIKDCVNKNNKRTKAKYRINIIQRKYILLPVENNFIENKFYYENKCLIA